MGREITHVSIGAGSGSSSAVIDPAPPTYISDAAICEPMTPSDLVGCGGKAATSADETMSRNERDVNESCAQFGTQTSGGGGDR